MKTIILYYIMIVFAAMAMAASTSVDSSESEDNTRLLQTSCKNLLRRGKCRQRSDCVWRDGQCRRASGCRRITKKQQCNATRNCEWHQQRQRCRRRVGGTTTTSSTPTTIGPITGVELSPSITAALTSRLERVDVFDICLCNNAHKPCVKATVDAIGDFIHGGNDCSRFKLKVVGGTTTLDITTNEDNCVCANSAAFLNPFFPYKGENCECFVI